MNLNRTIQLYKSSGENTKESGAQWKYALSNILKVNASSSKGFFVDNSDPTFDQFNVHENIELLLDQPPKKFATHNQWDTPVKSVVDSLNGSGLLGKASKLVSGAYNLASAIGDNSGTSGTWQPWVENVEAWKGAGGGVTFQYDFKFALGQYGLWNAKEEVVKPILNLMAPTFPQHLDAYSVSGPMPNALQYVSNMLSDIFDKDSDTNGDATTTSEQATGSEQKTSPWAKLKDGFESFGKNLEELILNGYRDYTYTIAFGNISTFYNMMIKESEVNWGNEVDQFGYPISGNIILTFSGIIPMSLTSSSTRNMSVRFGGTNNGNI